MSRVFLAPETTLSRSVVVKVLPPELDAVVAKALARDDGPVIAFSHGHFLRVLTLVFLGLPDGAGAALNLETAALSVLRRTERGNLLELWNDTGHLPGVSA